MKDMSVQVVLTGPYAGKTKVLNGHHFQNGSAWLHGQPENVNSALVYLGRAYQAYAVGSPELATALERNKANGLQRHFQNAPAKQDRAPAPVQSVGDNGAGPVPEARTLPRDGHAENPAGSAGMVPSGPGHENTRMGEGMESAEERESSALIRQIRKIILELDPAQETAWTPEGLPSLDTVAEAVSQPALTRADLEQVVPGWTRRKAAAALAEKVASL